MARTKSVDMVDAVAQEDPSIAASMMSEFDPAVDTETQTSDTSDVGPVEEELVDSEPESVDLEEEPASEPVPASTPSVYGFSAEGLSSVMSVGSQNLVPITLSTLTVGDSGYSNVLVEFSTDGPEGSTLTFSAIDSMGSPFTFKNTGSWGPGTGFPLPADYTATTDWTISADKGGRYAVTVSLKNVTDGTVITSAVFTGYFSMDGLNPLVGDLIATPDTPEPTSLSSDNVVWGAGISADGGMSSGSSDPEPVVSNLVNPLAGALDAPNVYPEDESYEGGYPLPEGTTPPQPESPDVSTSVMATSTILSRRGQGVDVQISPRRVLSSRVASPSGSASPSGVLATRSFKGLSDSPSSVLLDRKLNPSK